MSFQTERLLLRDFRADDHKWLAACYSERESHQNILRIQRVPRYGSMMASFAAKYAESVPFASREQLRFAVLLRDTLEPIGSCDLAFIAKGSHQTQLGWHFSNRFKGLGYATEAGRELIRIAFEERGLSRIALKRTLRAFASSRNLECGLFRISRCRSGYSL